MFKQPLFPKIAIDALIRGLMFTLISHLTLSGYLFQIPVLGEIVLVLLALIPVASAWFFCKSESSKRVLGFALCAFPFGILLGLIFLLLTFLFSIPLFPTGHSNISSSFLFILAMPLALLLTFLLRIVMFVSLMLKSNCRQATPEKTSGSAGTALHTQIVDFFVDIDWKRLWKNIGIALVAFVSLCLVLFVAINAFFNRMTIAIPDDGVWYCADLQAQFTFGIEYDYSDPDSIPTVDEDQNYIIINGDRIAATCGGLPNSGSVKIYCQEEDNAQYRMGDRILEFGFVRLTDTEFVLKDDDGTQYTFVKIGDTPSDDSESNN
ncbi:MAG: hypothetical protein IJO56_02210 [Oscillospiraceae bacterium]|nr:hypothetical protein [Oscillospiraceae bacterium]